jgi:hypothetical protein
LEIGHTNVAHGRLELATRTLLEKLDQLREEISDLKDTVHGGGKNNIFFFILSDKFGGKNAHSECPVLRKMTREMDEGKVIIVIN